MAVRILATNRLPGSLCVPNEPLRHSTAGRSARSASLFVGSHACDPCDPAGHRPLWPLGDLGGFLLTFRFFHGGSVDEGASEGCETYYTDQDKDGYGIDVDPKCTCGPGGTYTTQESGDCDDEDPDANLSATEQCNGKDDDWFSVQALDLTWNP